MYDTVGEGFSMNQRSVVASANMGSQRTGYVNIKHYDTRGKTVRVNFTQAAAAPVTVYNLYCSPNYLNWGSSEVINRDITVTSERVIKQGNDIISREDVPFTFELTGRDLVRFSAWTLDAKTIRVSPRGLNTSGYGYEAILVLNQTGTSERYSANLIQLEKLNNTIKFYKIRVDSDGLKWYTCSAQLPVQTDFPFTIHVYGVNSSGTNEASYGMKLEKGSMAWDYEFPVESWENIVKIDYTNFSDDYYNYIFTYTL